MVLVLVLLCLLAVDKSVVNCIALIRMYNYNYVNLLIIIRNINYVKRVFDYVEKLQRVEIDIE